MSRALYIERVTCLFFKAESCALELGATSKTVGASMAQLLTAAAQVSIGTRHIYSTLIIFVLGK